MPWHHTRAARTQLIKRILRSELCHQWIIWVARRTTTSTSRKSKTFSAKVGANRSYSPCKTTVRRIPSCQIKRAVTHLWKSYESLIMVVCSPTIKLYKRMAALLQKTLRWELRCLILMMPVKLAGLCSLILKNKIKIKTILAHAMTRTMPIAQSRMRRLMPLTSFVSPRSWRRSVTMIIQWTILLASITQTRKYLVKSRRNHKILKWR